MIVRFAAVVALLAPTLSSAGGSAAAPPPSAADESSNAWVTRMLARETAPLPRQKFSLASGAISAEVEGEAVTVRQEGGRDVLSISMGEDAPLVCTFLNGEVDGAGGLWRNAHGLAEAGHQILKSRPGEIVAFGGAPILFTEHIYAARTAKGFMPGHLKQAIWMHRDRPFACFFEPLGYSETFHRIVSGLAESLAQNAPAHAETRYAELQLLSVDGYDVGFGMLEVDAGKGSERVIRRISGLFSPEQPEIGAQHDRVTTQVDGSGAILSGRATGTKNGAPAYDVRIVQNPGGYLVEGTVSDKPVKASIVSKDALASEMLAARRLAILSERKDGEIRLVEWQPDENPTSAVQVRFRRDGSAPRRVCMARGDGPEVGCGIVDRIGLLERLSSEGRRPEIATRRVWSRGTL